MEDIGGDPACWLDRVCENCGRMMELRHSPVCEHCGARLLDGERETVDPDPARSGARDTAG